MSLLLLASYYKTSDSLVEKEMSYWDTEVCERRPAVISSNLRLKH